MRRLGILLAPRFIGVIGLAGLAGCGVTPQTAANLAAPPAFTATQNLIGATPATLSAEFGQPALLRIDGGAQVWLYHSASCGLNLILYPDAAGTPRVANVSSADGSAGTEGCTTSLQQAHFEAAPVAALEHPTSS